MRVSWRCIRHQAIDGEIRQPFQKDSEKAEKAAHNHLLVCKVRCAGHDAGCDRCRGKLLSESQKKIADACEN